MIWLTGSKGMLGQEFVWVMKSKRIPFIGTDSEHDICDLKILQDFAAKYPIDWIIHCAGYTKVNRAESEKEAAYDLNVKGIKNICTIAREKDAKLIYFSTDYVFDGKKKTPYTEEDEPNPVNYYGVTKLESDLMVMKELKKYYIFRISWLYSAYGHNFVKSIISTAQKQKNISVVKNQIGSPTYAKKLAENIVKCVYDKKDGKYGLYNYSDEGAISWYEFSKAIVDEALSRDIIEHRVTLKPISSKDYYLKTKRPAYSVLDKTKIKTELQCPVKSWKSNLVSFFDDYLSMMK